MDKICINGTIRDMTAEEMREQTNEVIQEETQNESLEERIKKLESLLAQFISLNK